MKLPHIIALCGDPSSGKSEVQKIITNLGAIAIDDGRPMRKFAVDWLGLSWDDVSTQKGKLKMVDIAGVPWQVRDILGTMGNKLEEMFGPYGISYMAARNLIKTESYVFGSARRDQGSFYKEMSGVVLGIRRPGVEPSKFEFDRFDETNVDVWIDNDGDLKELQDATFIALQFLPKLNRPIVWSPFEAGSR